MNGREAEVPRNAADDDAAHDTPSCIASLQAMLSIASLRAMLSCFHSIQEIAINNILFYVPIQQSNENAT
jgi:hypothetical protein